jgi:predicted dehydrogenase
VVELMIHDFDYLVWLLGKPAAVSGLGLVGPAGDMDHAFVALEYEGLRAEVEGSVLMPLSYPFRTHLRVVCEEGAIETRFQMDPAKGQQTFLMRYPTSGTPFVPAIPDEDPYWAECRYFVDCVQSKADPARTSGEAARDGLQVALAAKRSLERGGLRVKLA